MENKHKVKLFEAQSAFLSHNVGINTNIPESLHHHTPNREDFTTNVCKFFCFL